MAVEIKELHIRLSVSGDARRDASKESAGGTRPDAPGDRGNDRQELIAECVEQVFQILRAGKER